VLEGAYTGLKVLDFSHVVAGPMCTRLLADHGADVIKVESPAGDLLRNVPVEYGPKLTSHFAQYNCGKRSVVLDLKQPSAVELALELCDWADVIVENFSRGTLERLGIDVGALLERRPELIFCSVSTFGNYGPHADKPGFGYVAESYSGLMWLNGDGDEPPSFFGTPLADCNVGVHAFAAIGAALYRRARTGLGTRLDLSSFDALVTMIDAAVVLHTFTGGERSFGRFGTRHTLVVPASIIGTADGEYVTYGAPGDRAFARVAAAMGRPELMDTPYFGSPEGRVEHQDELYDMIEAWAATFATAQSLIDHFAQHGVPAARVRSVAECADDPALVERGTLQPVPVDGRGDVLVPTAPHPMTGARVAPAGPAPRLGEHSREVLRGVLSLDEARIDELISTGAVSAGEEEHTHAG
jgi:crotonobetainyl-CoA:carnitine CoA-transferase CaiB-like acyl-CoA transferase